MTTPHISAPSDAFAATCLLPGDPLRAKFIAETFLEDVTCVTSVRNMLGFTGHYKGQPISVMGTGMGMPSCVLYSTELMESFGVKRLVRVGSCGAIHESLKLNDVIVAHSASTDSNMNRRQFAGMDYSSAASPRLLQKLLNYVDTQALPVAVGSVFSTDHFYGSAPEQLKTLQQMGILAVEMESAGLYAAAARHRAQALTVLTVSDNLIHQTQLTPQEREAGFSTMIEITLNALVG
ncbi:purine-nucleoside phosphorylase [Pseudidiomarina terrestris]|uniref:Purine nucleoside phosphorylase DeoD-type n=1 Tax=Pseudidiomarina terrestris TaxID=2820060 RepID=A0AAW7QZQ2_9GAMM|nr:MULTISPECIES: purine-nucleoside phosphorylase [unclassified Pseudidiomarina]MDN7125681.1 purine-nucleoside phosphorylase [Pseudidiomarina sp. 1APP75-32.1]MDN7128130.1 purine-nucleoside phosphorylase [Pseudidiomarina sp. 1APR75-33.1]MDN7130672.1 purine-nucleoside phosphorylase [Pseudidiomarina sp. 1APR75-15]MDN7136587.1 purine-nucleoside phosphorylase [Pseudidiomarina sp. 1ASP75-5]MDN7138899.1 purine-nucleoside phosphorylase [Pseudidiomarina sp. 1ASP75-14]